MWIWIANKFAKFHAKRLNRSENIPKSFRGGATFFETPGSNCAASCRTCTEWTNDDIQRTLNCGSRSRPTRCCLHWPAFISCITSYSSCTPMLHAVIAIVSVMITGGLETGYGDPARWQCPEGHLCSTARRASYVTGQSTGHSDRSAVLQWRSKISIFVKRRKSCSKGDGCERGQSVETSTVWSRDTFWNSTYTHTQFVLQAWDILFATSASVRSSVFCCVKYIIIIYYYL